MPRARKPKTDSDGNPIKASLSTPSSPAVPSPSQFVPQQGEHAGTALVSLDNLVQDFLPETGHNLRVTFDRTGTTWYKIGLRSQRWPNHYLIVSLPSSAPFGMGVAAVLERLHLVNRGLIRPSPERWPDD